MLLAVIHPTQKRLNRATLVPLRLVIGNEFKVHGKKLLAFSRLRICYSERSEESAVLAAIRTDGNFAEQESLYYKRCHHRQDSRAHPLNPTSPQLTNSLTCESQSPPSQPDPCSPNSHTQPLPPFLPGPRRG